MFYHVRWQSMQLYAYHHAINPIHKSQTSLDYVESKLSLATRAKPLQLYSGVGAAGSVSGSVGRMFWAGCVGVGGVSSEGCVGAVIRGGICRS